MSYQSDETKAFAFVDKDLARLSVFCEQSLEILLCDVVGQVSNEQTTPLCVRLLTGFQQHGERCPKRLSIDQRCNVNIKTLKIYVLHQINVNRQEHTQKGKAKRLAYVQIIMSLFACSRNTAHPPFTVGAQRTNKLDLYFMTLIQGNLVYKRLLKKHGSRCKNKQQPACSLFYQNTFCMDGF